jgi:D-glycero-D-manno-heptose 1,7-bisphosphate phosphatase
MKRVVMLDRDGTVVIDRGYLADPEGLEFEPDAAEALRVLHASGHRLVVVTNQSGVGRGYFPLERLHAMNDRLLAMVGAAGAMLEAIYYCPHAPEEGCDCRKPEQGLMRRASAELHFDPRTAVVIGDRDSDVEFGRRAGATTILLDPKALDPMNATVGDALAQGDAARRGLSPARDSRADLVVPNLLAAARWLGPG